MIATAREQLDELHTFLSRNPVVSMPDSAGVAVAPTPEFFRWSSASMWTPGPFESKPSRAMYYLTDVDPKWEDDRKSEHLRDFNLPTLWTISIHEVYPGHFLHYQYLRKVESKVRRSTLFAPASYIEGWAHYCEQMMLEAGFGRGDHALKLGQLAEALVRLARFVVGIRLHTEDWSVEQGVRFFRDEAFLEEVERPARSRARHVRSDLPGLLSRQADAAEAASRLVRRAGRQAVAARVSRRVAVAGLGAVLGAAPVDAGEPSRRRVGVGNPLCRSTNTSATRARTASK